jgi:hypothetical protein
MVAIAVGCTVLASLAVTVPAAGAEASSSPRTLTSGDSALRDQIQLLTGSATELIYALNQTGVARYPNPPTMPVRELFARDVDGTTHDLGAVPAADSNARWSTIGDVVAADESDVSEVDVWSISAGTHSVFTVPAGAGYLSAGPQGIFSTDGSDLTLTLLAGGTVDYGTQYTAGGEDHLVAGTDGAIASEELNPASSTDGPVSYLPYATPGTAIKLAGGKNTAYTYCNGVDTNGVVCERDGGLALLPLGGGPAETSVSCRQCSDAVSGDTILWVGPGVPSGALHSRSPGGPRRSSSGLVGDTIVSAYGDAVVVNTSNADGFETIHHTVAYTATSARKLTLLFAAPHSAETAGVFSLTPHRLTYVADPPNAADPKGVTSVLSRTLIQASAGIDVRHAVTVGTDRNQYVPLAVATSGNSTIYTRPGTGQNFSVTIATPNGSTTVHNVLHGYSSVRSFDRNLVGLSKHWAMWTTRFGGLTVLNRTTNVRTAIAKKGYMVSGALSGHYLAYNTRRGDVRRENLNSGKVVTIYAPNNRVFRLEHATVAAYGHWVGWHLAGPGGFNGLDGMRNVRTMSKTVHLPGEFFALSNAGALLRAPTSMQFPIRTRLWTYRGKLKALLPRQTFNTLPQIAGHAIAWVTGTGQLELAHFHD